MSCVTDFSIYIKNTMKKFFNFIWKQYRKKWLLINLTIGAIISLFDLYFGVLTLIGLTAAIVLFVWIHSIYLLIKNYYTDDHEKEDKEGL